MTGGRSTKLVAAAVALAAAFTGGILGAAPVRADDASLRDAAESRDADFARLGRDTRSAARSWVRGGRKRPQRYLRLLRETRTVLAEVRAVIEREQPSSEAGAGYKTFLLRSLTYFHRGLRAERNGVAQGSRGERRRAERSFERSDSHYRNGLRYERRALAEFD